MISGPHQAGRAAEERGLPEPVSSPQKLGQGLSSLGVGKIRRSAACFSQLRPFCDPRVLVSQTTPTMAATIKPSVF